MIMILSRGEGAKKFLRVQGRKEHMEGALEGVTAFQRSFSFAIKQLHSTTTSLRAIGG
jgi:hypothetical protein